MTGAGALLELVGIEKSFGPVSVLRGVDLAVRSGEVHALLGENGAGKSTLMKILVGIERPNAGTMRLAGSSYAPASPRAARAAGVAIVPQERTLCPDLSVAENIALGSEPIRFGVVNRAAVRARAERALDLVGGRISPDAPVRELSVADRQLVEIARALAAAGEARVLILDEPTSSLGRDDADRLFQRVAALAKSGLAVILVTHFLGDVRAHAIRYTVLRDGKVQGSGDPKATEPEVIVRQMLGGELASARDTRAEDAGEREVLLEVVDVGGEVRPRAASFSLRRGEVLGIAGLVGSGRTELLRIVAGLDRARTGRVTVRAPRGVGLLSEDRGGEGLMLGRSIAENVTLSRSGSLFVVPRTLLAEGARWIAELAVKAHGPEQPAGELSGGNQQKVQLARLLREDYDVILVDEPTRGIDVASKAQVLGLVRDLARKGKGIVLVSSQFDELVATCDRIAILRRGELVPPAPASTFNEEKLLLEASS